MLTFKQLHEVDFPTTSTIGRARVRTPLATVEADMPAEMDRVMKHVKPIIWTGVLGALGLGLVNILLPSRG